VTRYAQPEDKRDAKNQGRGKVSNTINILYFRLRYQSSGIILTVLFVRHSLSFSITLSCSATQHISKKGGPHSWFSGKIGRCHQYNYGLIFLWMNLAYLTFASLYFAIAECHFCAVYRKHLSISIITRISLH
jgi:hypothetical protein